MTFALAPHAQGVSAPSGVIRNGLIGRWILDEGTGTTANDDSGNNFTGNLDNFDPAQDWVAGRLGSDIAARFRASVQARMDVAHDPLQNPANLTLTGWFCFHQTPNQWGGIFSKAQSNWNDGWAVYWQSDHIRFFVPGGYQQNAHYPFPTDDFDWHWFCATYDGTTKRLYLDNVEGTSNAGTSGTPGATVPIRAAFIDGGTYFQGVTEQDLRVYNRVLSASERAQIFSGTG